MIAIPAPIRASGTRRTDRHPRQGCHNACAGRGAERRWPIGGHPLSTREPRLASHVSPALDMTARVAKLRKDLPELIGVRSIPVEFDLRIGVATGEALVGSIGSEFMMS